MRSNGQLEDLLEFYAKGEVQMIVKNSFIDFISATRPPQLQKVASSPALLTNATDEASTRATTPTNETPRGLEKGNQDHTLHEIGTCSPCAYMLKPDGCRNGSSCKFCHYHTQDELHWWFRNGKKQHKKIRALMRRVQLQ